MFITKNSSVQVRQQKEFNFRSATSKSRNFIKYEKRFKKPLAGYASTSYNATKILLNAMKKAEFRSSAEVAKLIVADDRFDLNGDQ